MKSNIIAVILVLVTFFAISFITNIIGPLFPSLVKDFDISLAVAGFLPFSFFAAYGVMSIPAGLLVDKFSEKPVLIGAFVMSAFGSLLFALVPSFFMAMASLFCIGTGMAMLQVAINPLLRVSAGKEHFAFYSVFICLTCFKILKQIRNTSIIFIKRNENTQNFEVWWNNVSQAIVQCVALGLNIL